jgi:putative tricarboxylic transport membrane protein
VSNKQDLAISIVLLLLGAGVLIGSYQIEIIDILSFQDPVGASGFAFWVGAATILLASVQIIRQVRAIAVDAPVTFKTGDDERYPASGKSAVAIMLLTAAYVFLLAPLGYLIATSAYVGVGFRLLGGRGFARLVVFPIAVAVIAYLTFDTLLRVRLPEGIAEPFLEFIGLE